MAKLLVQLVIAGSQVLGRAFARALRQEIEASQEAARMRNQNQSRDARTERAGITLEEAKQILDVSNLESEQIKERYDKLFNANEKNKGGSFYLQSKIFRAKERLDYELSTMEEAKGPDLKEQQQK